MRTPSPVLLSRRIGCGLAMFVALSIVDGVHAQQPVPAAPKTLALLVGIRDYPEAAGLGALKGPEKDVERASAVLRQRFGFDPKGIKVLIGKDATHEGIVRAIKTHLIDKADKDTRVVLWFSGHGSRIPDASKADGSPRDDGVPPFDETFVAYDSRVKDPAGGYDLTDDELFSLLSAIRSKDIVLITDCCHSGGLLRGGPAPGVREASLGTAPLKRELLKPFWPDEKVVPWLDDDKLKDIPASVVHIAACGADQEAGEIDFPIGTFGTLTWHLTSVLRDIEKEASWHRVALTVRARVAGNGSRGGQLVAISGDAERALFGGSGTDVRIGHYQVDSMGGPDPKRFLVGAGTLFGIGEGAELLLHDLDGKEVGTARVYKVGTTSCNVEWTAAGEPPHNPMRAWPKTMGDTRSRLRVHLGSGVEAQLLSGVEVVRLVDTADADYTLHSCGDCLELWTDDGVCARRMAPAVADVRRALEKEHQFRTLWEGVAAAGRFDIGIEVAPATPAQVTDKHVPAALLRTSKEGDKRTSTVVGATTLDGKGSGGLVVITVTNRNKEDLNIALVSASQDREVNVLLSRVLAAGTSTAKLVVLGPGKNWPGGKPMIDRYIVVATPRFADFKPFESSATEGVKRGSGDEGLPPFLQSALGGTRTRGDTDKPDWGIAVCDLQLVTPDVFRRTQGK